MSSAALLRDALEHSAAQRQRDRSSGIPLLTGAREHARLVGWMLALGAKNNGHGSAFDQTGSIGQRFLLERYAQELFGSRAEAPQRANSAGTGLSTVSADDGAAQLAASAQSALRCGIRNEAIMGATTGASTEAITGTTLGSPILSQLLGAAGAAYSLYGLVSGFGHSTPATGAAQGVAAGAYIGSIVPGIGTLLGGAIGGALGGLIGLVHTGKHVDQIARDRLRGFLQKTGLIDERYALALADGTQYDIGKDGGHRYSNLDGTLRRAYETDTSNPLTAQAIGWVDPLAAALTGGNEKLRSDLAGYLTNAATSNASTLDAVRANIRGFYDRLGIDPEKALRLNASLSEMGAVDNNTAAAYSNSIATLFS